MPPPHRVVIVEDNVDAVVKGVTELLGQQVLIGIPDSNTDRDDTENQGPITNAALGYIHETGAPEANIPARPFLIPGVENSHPQTIPRLEAAGEAALDGNMPEAIRQLKAAGMIAEASVKDAIEAGAGWLPLKPATIRNRKYARGTKSRRQSEETYITLVFEQGMQPAEAQTITGIHALINTAQLRNAITSVMRKKK